MIGLSSAYDITLMLYNLSLFPIILFSVLFIILTLLNLFMTKKKDKFPKLKKLPFVSVQIPTFNDPIAERCVRKCMEFDYPKDKYEIIIVDDSTDIKTQRLLKKFADENPGFIKYTHRTSRKGFKPGALKEAMSITKGEILVIFDADWIPKKSFLKRVVMPFADENVAIVQTRQGFYNKDTNLITRFAAYTLMIYHTIVMPINNRINSVFFCGTAGAIRRKAFDEVGGWNMSSITEDSELSVKLLIKGYRTVYLDDETPSEVPDTFEAFVKQQMRWCYGNARVFFDNAGSILFSRLSIRQKIMIMYITIGNIIAPVVVFMTLFGLSGWFLGEVTLFNLGDAANLVSRFIYTAGFIIMGLITLYKHNQVRDFWYLVASTFTIGLVIAVANSIAFIRAVFNMGLHWHCTPKVDNVQVALK